MLLPTGPSSPTDWSSHQAAIQNSSPNAWSGSKVAAATLGIILGIIVIGTLLWLAVYKVHRLIRDVVSKEVEAAIERTKLERGRSNDQRSDPSSRPPPSSSDRPTTQNTSPADVAPPPDEEYWRHPACEHSFPTLHIISPRMPSPLSRSPERFQYPPFKYGAPQSSYEKGPRGRPRRCNIADLPTILPRMSAHGSGTPRSPSPQMERRPGEGNVGELRAFVPRVPPLDSDFTQRGSPYVWYSSSESREPPPTPPPSPEREGEREERQSHGQRPPVDDYLPVIVRKVSARHSSSSRRRSSRRRTSYVRPYATSNSPSDRGSAEGSSW